MAGRKRGKIPVVRTSELFWYDNELKKWNRLFDIHRDWKQWQKWLNDDYEKSFRFEHSDGIRCTVLKEKRKHYGGDPRPVWYAHRRLDGKLKRKRLSKP